MEILKIVTIAMVGLITASIVRNIKAEFAIYIVIATVVLLFMMILDKLTSVFAFVEAIYSQLTYGKTFFPIIIKVLAVAYLADFTSQLCIDAGEKAIAGKVELAGKVLIFYLAIPILTAILQLINSIL